MMYKFFRPFKIVYIAYAIILFVVLMIPVFLWVIAVAPLGKIKGGNLTYKACIVWADVWCFLIFIRHKNIYLEPLKEDESYIFVANHISYLDSALVPKIFRQPVRPLGKVEMVKLPLFGFIYKNAIVTVDRSSIENRTKSVQQLKAVLRKGISVLVFAEGTFNMTHKPLKEFYDGAFKIAIETGTPVKPVLILDAYDRMHYSTIWSLNPGKSRAIFLPEVSVDGLTIEDVAFLKIRVFDVMEKALIKYGASWIK